MKKMLDKSGFFFFSNVVNVYCRLCDDGALHLSYTNIHIYVYMKYFSNGVRLLKVVRILYEFPSSHAACENRADVWNALFLMKQPPTSL